MARSVDDVPPPPEPGEAARPVPYDLATEQQVIGFILSDYAGEDVAADLSPEDFYDQRHARIFAEWRPKMPMGELAERAGVEQRLLLNAMAAAPAGLHLNQAAAGRLVLLAYRRRALAHGTSMAIAARAGNDDELHRLIDDIDSLGEPVGSTSASIDAVSFIDQSEDPYDWVVDGVLEAGDRLLITAGEGMGKSVFLAQCAAQTAAGVHWWTLRKQAPQRVLYVDLENNERMIRRRLRWLEESSGADLSELRVEVRTSGLDLTTRGDTMWLAGKVKANAPRLLVIGPLYRMFADDGGRSSDGGEQLARKVVKSLDRIRSTYGCALLMETHAPHADKAGSRDLRPFGSSVWLRWPEFGLGFRRDVKDPNRFAAAHWRGPRDQRVWPTALHRDTQGWPWKARLAQAVPTSMPLPDPSPPDPDHEDF